MKRKGRVSSEEGKKVGGKVEEKENLICEVRRADIGENFPPVHTFRESLRVMEISPPVSR